MLYMVMRAVRKRGYRMLPRGGYIVSMLVYHSSKTTNEVSQMNRLQTILL